MSIWGSGDPLTSTNLNTKRPTWSVSYPAFDVTQPPYGAKGDGTPDDLAAFQAAFADAFAAGNQFGGGAMVEVPPGVYDLSGNPFLGIHTSDRGLVVHLNGAQIKIHKQLVIPAATRLIGNVRFSGRIKIAADFVTQVNVVAVALVSGTATVTTDVAHNLEVGDTVIMEGVSAGVFDGGWLVASAPTATTFTFALVIADTTSSGGTVTIPYVVIGNQTISQGSILEHAYIDGSNLAHSVGVFSNTCNEQSGLKNVVITSMKRGGLWIERSGSQGALSGPQNYTVENVEISVTPGDASAFGVKVVGTYSAHRGFNGVSVGTPNAGGTIPIGFDLSGAQGVYSRLHCENCDDGIVIGSRGQADDATSSSAAMIVEGITAHSSVANVVRLTNAAETHDIVVMGVSKSNASNVLKDDLLGYTLAANWLGIYIRGQRDSAGESPVFSTDTNVIWIAPNDLWVGFGATKEARTVAVSSASGFARRIAFKTGATSRWQVRTNASTESGSDLGSNFEVVSFTDAGSEKSILLSMNRSTGTTAFLAPLSAPMLSATSLFGPSSGTATGATGQLAWDNAYIYVCKSTNSWSRATLNAF